VYKNDYLYVKYMKNMKHTDMIVQQRGNKGEQTDGHHITNGGG